MPAEKAHRRSKTKQVHNHSIMSETRTIVSAAKKAISSNDDTDQVNELVNKAVQQLDKVAGKKLIHKNTAARSKSRLIASAKSATE
ncbi:MAG: 30S ribosomal protein S20 [Dehalococcoidia bacterium]